MSIYFDNNATTPLAPEVREFLVAHLDEFGNASSVHQAGQQAKRLVNTAREQMGALLGCQESELIFSSGGTEALNTVLLANFLPDPQGKHLIVSSVEHSAVLETAHYLESLGAEVTRLKVDRQGRLDLEELRLSFKPQTKLVAIMWANNEIGNFYDVQAIGEICQEKGVPYLCDAVQVVGTLPIDLKKLPIDYLVASAHKFHGPKGVGFLYRRSQAPLSPLIRGGRQERGMRAGTENILGIAAMAKALQVARFEEVAEISALRDRMEAELLKLFSDLRIHGELNNRLPGTSNFALPGVSGETLLMNLDMRGVQVSLGAACESGSMDPSHVLLAMGFSPQEALDGLRISLSRYNSQAEVDSFINLIKDF
ncbi:MAG: cysteine desulfurase [Deltaproteobacteria bacterium]|nr:cysteine desulfurase [Deltaproteobacteria bacterium]